MQLIQGARRTGLFLLAALVVGCNQGDVDRLNRVGKKTKNKVAGATRSAQGKLASGLGSLTRQAANPSVRQRVEQRLRWDKELEDVDVIVSAKGNAIELRGLILTEKQKTRVLSLVGSTVGVEKIVDGLTLGSLSDAAEGKRP